MNERIKELSEQAINENLWAHEFVEFNELMEKFAKLIVQECMDIAHNVGTISEPDDWAADRCYEIEQRIQDRFGVE